MMRTLLIWNLPIFEFMKEKYLTTDQVAKILEIDSPETIHNWLEGGQFPGSFLNDEGYWQFPLYDVELVKSRMNIIKNLNIIGDIYPSDTNDDFQSPLS